MAHLSASFVRRAICPPEKQKVHFYDDEIKGFMLEARATGGKTFYMRLCTPEGKNRYFKLCDAKHTSAQEARIKALKLKRSVEEGKDVVIGIKKEPSELLTLKVFYAEYYLPYIQRHVKSWQCNDSTFRVHILPALGDMAMNAIKKSDIMKLHVVMLRDKKLKPASANKLLSFLTHAYNIAIDLECEGIVNNPVKQVKPFVANNERDRFINKRETSKLIHAVDESLNIHLKYIIPFLILTGARRNEVLHAKWRDMNMEKRLWIIPISKSGKKRIVPISDALYALLEKIPRKSVYLFPSPVTQKPYKSIQHSWDNARNKAGLKDVRLHDLRHTFASALVNNGRSLYEVQQLLGHSTPRMSQRYAHLSNDSLMKAANCAGKLFS